MDYADIGRAADWDRADCSVHRVGRGSFKPNFQRGGAGEVNLSEIADEDTCSE